MNSKATPEEICSGDDVLAFLIHNSSCLNVGKAGELQLSLSYFGAVVDGLSGFYTDLINVNVAGILGDNMMNILVRE